MALINHYLDRNQTVKTQKENMSLYINGEWFGFLTEPFNPTFGVSWQESGYANIVKGLAGLGKGAIVKGFEFAGKRAGDIAQTGMDFLSSQASVATEVARLGGYASGQTGLMKKKIFDSPNFWDYTAVVEIVDMDGSGLVMDLFHKLKNYALPSVAGGKYAELAGDAVGTVVDTITKNITDFDTDALAGAISRSVVKAPRPVHIKIGNYANTEGATTLLSIPMVINSFTPVFSKEQTEKGPIKMELTIDLSTTEPMVSDAVPVRGGRVTINGETDQAQIDSQQVLDNVPKPNF